MSASVRVKLHPRAAGQEMLLSGFNEGGHVLHVDVFKTEILDERPFFHVSGNGIGRLNSFV